MFTIGGAGGGAGGAEVRSSSRVYRNWLGEPAPMPETRLGVARAMIPVRTVAGVASGLPCRYSAAAPATCGDAIDVPLMVFTPPLSQVETTFSPGAYRSRQLPLLLNHVSWSTELVAPTVMAAGTR